MRPLRHAMPFVLGATLCASSLTALADPPSGFEGQYKGQMTLQPSGLNNNYTAPACSNERAASMSVRSGYVLVTYQDWHGHMIHYKGRVAADGSVKAWHRNNDGVGSLLTGNITGGQFSANITRGRCDYALALSKV